ncbi:MAG: response regulator [Pseudomonadota bacterium]|nr:response regulator [Pseudomonadota bacterium]
MPATLLIVDDSKSSRKVNLAFARELLGDTVNCLEAAGGAEALEILATQRVDVALLDLTMPGINGFDVLAEMRRQNMSAKIIVVSADIQKQTKERVAAMGAVGFIDKPIKLDALRALLTKLGMIHD